MCLLEISCSLSHFDPKEISDFVQAARIIGSAVNWAEPVLAPWTVPLNPPENHVRAEFVLHDPAVGLAGFRLAFMFED